MTTDVLPVSVPDHVRDLWAEPRVGTLGVVRRDGTPHLTPVKSVLDEGPHGPRVLVLTRPGTVKAAAVRRTGRASLAEHTLDADWATLEGPTHVSHDPALLDHARRLYAARYGAGDRGATGDWGRCVVVIDVERVLTGS